MPNLFRDLAEMEPLSIVDFSGIGFKRYQSEPRETDNFCRPAQTEIVSRQRIQTQFPT